MDVERLRQRVGEIRDRIHRAGGVGVQLVAVTKTWGAEAMIGAHEVGCDGVGENYAQELIRKIALVPPSRRLPVHFIGQMQTNKVKLLIDIVDVWQSVDRASLVDELIKRSRLRAKTTPTSIMLQVNTTGESTKAGCDPADVPILLARAVEGGLLVSGLMTIGPTNGEVGLTRRAFRLLGELADAHGLVERSMGMSGDFEIGVELGATLVRVGTALFGERPSGLTPNEIK
ncbi:MAG: YggS family pyridoxal phosphate-dependent enzyme [Ilumatobacteraceae bacterium]